MSLKSLIAQRVGNEKTAELVANKIKTATALLMAGVVAEDLRKAAASDVPSVAEARNEDKVDAVAEHAEAILAGLGQTGPRQKPGSLHTPLPPAAPIENPVDGKMAAAIQDTTIRAYSALIGDVKTAAQASRLNAKVACIVGCGAGCGFCGSKDGKMTKAAADASRYVLDVLATDLSARVLAKRADEVAAAIGADSADFQAIHAAAAAAAPVVGAEFEPLMMDHPKMGLPDFGGSSIEFNPLWRMLEPNWVHQQENI